MNRSLRRAAASLSLFTIAMGSAACSTQREAAPSDESGGGAHISHSASPIIGGTADTTDTFVVGIDIAGSAICSGALIAPNLVLTARHCVSDVDESTGSLDCSKPNNILYNHPPSDFTVSTNRDYTGSPKWGVSKVWYLNDAACTSSVTPECQLCGYDLALLELKGGSYPTSTVAPSVKAPTATGGFEAIGYGCESTGAGCGTVGYRQSLMGVSIVDVAYRSLTIDGAICNGDSGSPLYNPGDGTIYGTLSRGSLNCTTAEGIYTRLDLYWSWLAAHATTAATDGGYTAPAWVSATAPAVSAGTSPLGTFCVLSDECASDECFSTSGRGRCSKACTTATDCAPSGFDCLTYTDPTGGSYSYCWPQKTTPDAGTPPPVETGPKSPLGADCTGNADCTSGICVTNGSAKKCSATCSKPTDCAASGYDCISGFCWPSAPASDAGAPDAGDDASSAVDASSGGPTPTTSSSGGCSQASGRGGAGAWLAFAAVLPLISRRRRRGLARSGKVA